MTDIFREVDEDIRQDRLKSLWDKFGIYVLGICIGIVFAVGGLKWWQYYQNSVAEEAGTQYLAAIDLIQNGKASEASQILAKIAEDAPNGYSILARFQNAATLASSGDKQTAVSEYVRLSKDGSLSSLLQGLANVRAAILLIDTGSRQDVEARVAKLNTRDGPWRNSARELLGLAAYKAGDVAAADALYNEIAGDPAASASIRQRAQLMLSLLAPERKPTSKDGKSDNTQSE